MRKNRGSLAAAAVLLALSMVLAACGPKQSAPPASPGTEQQQGGSQTQTPPETQAPSGPKVGGELNLRLAQDPDNLNPILSSSAYGSAIYGLVYSSLFDFDVDWSPKPDLAERWETLDNGLTFRVYLRQGVKFHDGAELTSEDVVFTMKAIKHPDYTGPRAASLASIEDIVAVDKYTVDFKLSEPFAPIFTNINYGILQAKLFEGTEIGDLENHEVTWHPIGTGPYIFKEYVRGQYALLERNPNWFRSEEEGGAPFIQTIRMKVIPDDQTALAALENGELDVETPTPSEVQRLKTEYAGRLIPVEYERNGWGYMLLNTTQPPLDDVRVRQALTYALDRESIVQGALNGEAVVPPGPIPPVSWAFKDDLKTLAYDPAKAEQLLQEAGFTKGANGIYEKDGKPLKLRFYATEGSSLIEALATIARQNWLDVGIEVDVQFMDFNAMNQTKLQPGDYDISFQAFNLGLDPDSLYAIFHGSLAKPNAEGLVTSFNRMRYDNPEVNALLEAGRRESDPEKRKEIYGQAQQLIVNDAPVILIYSNLYTDFHTPRVKGIVNFPGAGATLDYLYKWYIEE